MKWIIGLGLGVVTIVVALVTRPRAAVAVVLLIAFVSYNNQEARLRNLIVAKQKDNHSQLDNTIKVIAQSAQVTQAQTSALREIIIGNADARATKGGSLATLVHEAVPNLDASTETFRNLQNQIVAARNTWTENQRQLVDYKREHDNLFDVMPSSFFMSMMGKEKIEIQIVTSTRTEESFNSGKDDDIKVFQ